MNVRPSDIERMRQYGMCVTWDGRVLDEEVSDDIEDSDDSD